jgi:hypothetical protein
VSLTTPEMLAWANTAAGAPMMDTSPTSTSRPTFVMHQLLSVSNGSEQNRGHAERISDVVEPERGIIRRQQ